MIDIGERVGSDVFDIFSVWEKRFKRALSRGATWIGSHDIEVIAEKKSATKISDKS